VLIHPAGEEPVTDFIIKQLPYDLSNQASLALIGKYLKRINISSLVDPAFLAWARCAYASQRTAKAYLHRGTPSSAGAPKKNSPGQEVGKRVLFCWLWWAFRVDQVNEKLHHHQIMLSPVWISPKQGSRRCFLTVEIGCRYPSVLPGQAMHMGTLQKTEGGFKPEVQHLPP
jgi:hypothetical protein